MGTVDPVIFTVAERLGRRPAEVAGWPYIEIVGWAAHFNVRAAQSDMAAKSAEALALARGR